MRNDARKYAGTRLANNLPTTLGPTISSYRIVRLLGEGGMGSVYEAVQDAINRRVAIKVLHPQYARNPELVKRFLNEARAANLVPHPAMIQVSECGLAEDGTAFLVMEYLAGETLAARLQRHGGRLSESVAISFAWQLATALAAAHERAIVHRDLKPGNVMLVRDPAMPAGERVKLLDFGIAKLGQQLAAPDAVHTRTGVMMGTPLYMAPEQCLGAAQVDGKADVYSLGVMMFEMLAGTTPFASPVDLVVLNMHISKPPPALHKVAPITSKSVAKLVQQMLSKSAHDRPTMKAVAQVLHEQAALAIRVSSPDLMAQDPDETTLLHCPSSTLHNGTGQLTVVPPRLPLVALVAGAALTVTALVSLRQHFWGHQSPSAVRGAAAPPSAWPRPAAPPEPVIDVSTPVDRGPRRVTWSLASQPPGAAVVRVADHAVLGNTPWTQAQPAAAGQLALELRLKGYRAKLILIPLDADADRIELLDKDPKLREKKPVRKPARTAEKPLENNPPKRKPDDPAQRIID